MPTPLLAFEGQDCARMRVVFLERRCGKNRMPRGNINTRFIRFLVDIRGS